VTATPVRQEEPPRHNVTQVTATPAPVAVRQRQPPARTDSQRRQIEVPNATQVLIKKLFTRQPRIPKPRIPANGVTSLGIRRLSDSSLESPPMLRRNDHSDVFTSDCLDTLERSLIGRPTSNSIDSLQRLRTESPPPPYDFVTAIAAGLTTNNDDADASNTVDDFFDSVIASCVTSD
jgi:hypothetical protein